MFILGAIAAPRATFAADPQIVYYTIKNGHSIQGTLTDKKSIESLMTTEERACALKQLKALAASEPFKQEKAAVNKVWLNYVTTSTALEFRAKAIFHDHKGKSKELVLIFVHTPGTACAINTTQDIDNEITKKVAAWNADKAAVNSFLDVLQELKVQDSKTGSAVSDRMLGKSSDSSAANSASIPTVGSMAAAR